MKGLYLSGFWGELLGHGGPPRFGQLTREEQNERKKKKIVITFCIQANPGQITDP